MPTETKVIFQDNGELVELTGEDAELYLADIAEQVESLNQIKAELVAKEEAKANGMAKLIALGLTEEEAGALIG